MTDASFGIATAPQQVEYLLRAATRDAVGAALDAGLGHIVLSLRAPYPDGVARWVADEIITPWLR